MKKKFLSLLLAALMVLSLIPMTVFATPVNEGFGIILGNGTTIKGQKNEAQTEFTEYTIEANLTAGDTFQLCDFGTEAAWTETNIDEASTANLTINGNEVYEVAADGKYTIYLKMISFGNNQVYVAYEGTPAPTGNEKELFNPQNASVDHTWGQFENPNATWNSATKELSIEIIQQAEWQWGNQVFLGTGITTLDTTKEYQVSFTATASTDDCGDVTFKAFDDNQIAIANQNLSLTTTPFNYVSDWTTPSSASANGMIVFDFGLDPAQTVTITNISIKERTKQPQGAITNGTPESAKEANHGYITVDETAAEGATVTVTVTPNEGYKLKSLKYNDGTDHEITKDATSGNYQFTMPAKAVTITATFEAAWPKDAPAVAPATPTVDGASIIGAALTTDYAFEALDWPGNMPVKLTFATGETIYYSDKMTWQIYTNWAEDFYDMSQYSTLHIDLFPATGTGIKVTIEGLRAEDGGQSYKNSVVKTLTAGQWNGLDIALSEFPALSSGDAYDFSDIRYLILEGYNAEQTALSVGNVYFYGNTSHTHNLVKVNGQAATETAAGFKDYYECKDSADACHKYFEDATAKVEITDLNAWKAQGGKGYMAPLVHSITPVNGKNATDTEAGYKPYYECKNCGKYYEDATGLIEITDIGAWKSQTGKGYIPIANEINAAKTAAKAALDSENAKDALLDETALTNGKSAIDSAKTLADIENAKNAAITAIQEAQATELANAKDAAKSALDTEDAQEPLTDKTALTDGKNSIDGATTKAAIESAKKEAIAEIQAEQPNRLAAAKAAAKVELDAEFAQEPLADKTALEQAKEAIDKATNLADIENAKNAAVTAIQEAQATEHKDPKSPEAGDTSHVTLWVILIALAAMGLCAFLVLAKKRKKKQ